MKKNIFLGLLVIGLMSVSCRKDTYENVTKPIDISIQNEYDEKAIQQFLKDNYFDDRGKIVEFSSTDTNDDNEKPLSDYNPVTLPDGTVYIIRPDAQPDSGELVGEDDVINLMQSCYTYVATNEEGFIKLRSKYPFQNTIDGDGVPIKDPLFFHADEKMMKEMNVGKDYFEIKGFKEAIQNFKGFNLPDEAGYNLQGVIIVPSKSAFARSTNHYNYTGYSLQDRTFVFNFQIYKAQKRN